MISMGNGSTLPLAIRRAVRKELIALVTKMGGQLAVAAALDVSPRAIRKAETYGAVDSKVLERLLGHLALDETALLERHAAESDRVLPA
jgi:hypothetical protein